MLVPVPVTTESGVVLKSSTRVSGSVSADTPSTRLMATDTFLTEAVIPGIPTISADPAVACRAVHFNPATDVCPVRGETMARAKSTSPRDKPRAPSLGVSLPSISSSPSLSTRYGPFIPAKAVRPAPPRVNNSAVAVVPSASSMEVSDFSKPREPATKKNPNTESSMSPEARIRRPWPPSMFMVMLVPVPVITGSGKALKSTTRVAGSVPWGTPLTWLMATATFSDDTVIPGIPTMDAESALA